MAGPPRSAPIRRVPDRAALVSAGATVSYAELYARALSVAGGLLDAGVQPGDRVALRLPSEPLVVALHALLLLRDLGRTVFFLYFAGYNMMMLRNLRYGESYTPDPDPADWWKG